MAKDWRKAARETVESSDYIKFKDGQKQRITFLDAPEVGEFTGKDGKTKPSFDFPVEVDGEEKTWSVTSKKLLDLILEEDDDNPIEGRTFDISCKGEGFDRRYRMKEVPGVQSYGKKKKAEPEEEEEGEEEEDEKVQKDDEDDHGDDEENRPSKKAKKPSKNTRRAEKVAELNRKAEAAEKVKKAVKGEPEDDGKGEDNGAEEVLPDESDNAEAAPVDKKPKKSRNKKNKGESSAWSALAIEVNRTINQGTPSTPFIVAEVLNEKDLTAVKAAFTELGYQETDEKVKGTAFNTWIKEEA